MGAIKDGEPVPGHPDGAHAGRPLALGGVGVLAVGLLGDGVEVVGAVLQVGGPGHEQHGVLGGVVAHVVDGASGATPQLEDGLVLLGGEVQLAKVTLLDVVEEVSVESVGRSLPLKLEF